MVGLTNIIWLVMSVLITACATQESSLRARAEAGDAEAQYQLASMYWQGKEIDQNRNEALKWYQRAAQHGHQRAQFKVAELYEAGQRVSQDYLLAHNGTNERPSKATSMRGCTCLRSIGNPHRRIQYARSTRGALHPRLTGSAVPELNNWASVVVPMGESAKLPTPS